ncbi:hypothetical protein M0R45_006111 [Rubus argutus]|uniref:Uncharacterized protein n=1 Tax=Rubus argutus TaxID=59490 RepID=A0AAW1YPI9_RUBAR
MNIDPRRGSKHLNLDFQLIKDETIGQHKLKIEAGLGTRKTSPPARVHLQSSPSHAQNTSPIDPGRAPPHNIAPASPQPVNSILCRCISSSPSVYPHRRNLKSSRSLNHIAHITKPSNQTLISNPIRPNRLLQLKNHKLGLFDELGPTETPNYLIQSLHTIFNPMRAGSCCGPGGRTRG